MTRVRASSNLRERAALETEGVKSRAPRGRAVAHGRGGGQAFLYVDPSTAGIAGSMLLGGLMDAMVPARRRALLKLFARSFVRKGFSIDHGEVKRRGFRAFYIDGSAVALDTHQLAAQTAKAARTLALSAPAKELAGGVVQILIDLEAEVHGVPTGRVHLHELAGYD